MYRIFADLINSDKQGRVRLITKGAINDIQQQSINMEHGLEVLLYDYDGLETHGTLEFSEIENIWVAKIDWNEVLGHPRY